MLTTYLFAFGSVILISLVSLIGVFTISIHPEKLKKYLIYLVSFAAGGLFGGAFIHLLPKTVKKFGFSTNISFFVLLGIVVMFLIEKVVHWRHCHHPVEENDHKKPVAIMSLIGDGVHNFIDGLVIGASYLIGLETGIVATLAVIIHEIPQEIGDFGVLMHGGFSRMKALLFNFFTATTAIGGTLLAFILNNYIQNINSLLIPFAVGNFVYIAGADFVPELHHEDNDISKSTLQFITFVLGISVMFLVKIINTQVII